MDAIETTKRGRGGTAPNTSLVLTESELGFINEKFGGSKSAAIHAALAQLEKAMSNGTSTTSGSYRRYEASPCGMFSRHPEKWMVIDWDNDGMMVEGTLCDSQDAALGLAAKLEAERQPVY